MTVSTVVDHNDYTGNGVTTSFPYTFRIFKKADLVVSVVDLSESITVLVLDTDYTVTNAGSYNGGNVVLTAPLVSGWKISISRELEPTQETDLRNQGKFFAEVHEDAFDKLTMLIQQVGSMFRLALRKPSSIANWYDALNNYIRNLKDPRDPQDAATKNYTDTELGRTLRVPEQINQLPAAADRANKMPAFDSLGKVMVVVPPSGSASDVLIELAKPTGASLIGVQPQGDLADIINWVTPEQFGAVGDGVHDDTSAIQAAIDYVSGVGGGTVEFAAKVYRAAGIVLKPMVRLKGEGVTLTTIKAPDNWSAVAVIYSVDFTDYVDQDKSTLPIHGAYGAAIHDLYVDGNYNSFSGTPARLYGHGLALGGTIHLDEVEVMYCPSSCLMKFNYQGSPNQQPPWWPANKGLHAVNQHGNVVCKWAGYDTVIIYEPDGVYSNLLVGMSARGMGSSDMTTRSLWDASRICVVAEFPSGITILKGHFYAGLVGAIFRGTATRWDYIVMETVSVGFWTTTTSQVQGGVSDIHNCDSSRQLTGIPAINNACPAFIIQSGGTGTGNSELASSYGKINVLNYTVSSVLPDVYFCGAHGWINGKHNLAEVNIQRSRFLAEQDQRGGIGLILQGKQCSVTGQIVGFWKTDHAGTTSCAVQVQPGASFNVNLTIARCALGLRWSSSSDKPRIVGTLNFAENIATYTESYGSNATLQQLGILSMHVPSGGNRCNYTSTSNLSVTTTSTQTINVSTTIADSIPGSQGLPYIPRLGEVTAEVVNTNQPQTQYPGVISVQYEPASSSLTNLVFKVRMRADPGDSAGVVLLAKIG